MILLQMKPDTTSLNTNSQKLHDINVDLWHVTM